MYSYTSFTKALQELGFEKFYLEHVSNLKFSIHYGKRKGELKFESVLDAGRKFSYDNKAYQISIDIPVTTLRNEQPIDSKDLLITCIEIFDWGGVQNSNILSALSLHRENRLTDQLQKSMIWFEDDYTLSEPDFEGIWSSGWTKVYSFLFNTVVIYDSRSAAFINQILLKFYSSLDAEDQIQLSKITSGLLSFGGSTTRSRKINAEDRKKLSLLSSTNFNRKMVANKKASWFIRYLVTTEGLPETQSSFRLVDKAAFMLGFDLNQWNK